MKSDSLASWWERRRDESGDTLIELLIAMLIMGITAVSITSAFTTAIAASAQHKSLSNINALLRSYAEVATSQIQLQANPIYTSCAGFGATAQYSLTNLPTIQSGYSISLLQNQYWNGTQFTSVACTAGSKAPQLITLSATGPYNQSGTLSFVVASYANTPVATSAPAITSANSFSGTTGSAFSFTVTTSGSPPPSLSESGALPAGVTFVDNGDGTATLSGTASVAAGSTTITLTANNSVGSPATQSFTLTVVSPPVITSTNHVTWTHSTKVAFTVTATGSPTPALSESGTLPPNVTFIDQGNGTAIMGTGNGKLTATTGTYVITITANSGAINTSQTFTITVV